MYRNLVGSPCPRFVLEWRTRGLWSPHTSPSSISAGSLRRRVVLFVHFALQVVERDTARLRSDDVGWRVSRCLLSLQSSLHTDLLDRAFFRPIPLLHSVLQALFSSSRRHHITIHFKRFQTLRLLCAHFDCSSITFLSVCFRLLPANTYLAFFAAFFKIQHISFWRAQPRAAIYINHHTIPYDAVPCHRTHSHIQ